jgi:hypothetical protein
MTSGQYADLWAVQQHCTLWVMLIIDTGADVLASDFVCMVVHDCGVCSYGRAGLLMAGSRHSLVCAQGGPVRYWCP